MGESLAKMLFEQALEGDAEEPCGCLREPLQTGRTAHAKALGQHPRQEGNKAPSPLQ